MEPKGLLQALGISQLLREKMERSIMYDLFLAYVATESGKTVDTSQAATRLVKRFKGRQLVAAAYIFSAIEQELKTGENFFLLEDLRQQAQALYKKLPVSAAQFDRICNEVTRYYRETGRIQPAQTN